MKYSKTTGFFFKKNVDLQSCWSLGNIAETYPCNNVFMCTFIHHSPSLSWCTLNFKFIVVVVGVLLGPLIWASLVHKFSQTRLLLVRQKNGELRMWSRGERRDTAEN